MIIAKTDDDLDKHMIQVGEAEKVVEEKAALLDHQLSGEVK